MFTGQTVFAQILEFLPRHEFDKCVARYKGNYRVRRFSCRDQFVCLAFAQLTYRESLRDIETCLRAMGHKLYHAGFRGNVARNTLAKANERRDWRIWADVAQILITKARRLYCNEHFGVELEQTAYAFDSTTIDLCLTLFRWAPFREHKAAIKVHTLIDLRGNIPCFLVITPGKVHDVNILDQLPLESGSFYVMDKAYVDFARLFRINQSGAFFVTRAKKGLAFKRLRSFPVDRYTGLRSDQLIRLTGPKTSKRYPLPMRRIAYRDPETGKRYVFLTNNLTLPAMTITQLYKRRWQIELFFKWIKMHLRIKAFYGTSENAVKTQVWTTVAIYVLVAIIKKELGLERSMYEILQILSISIFEKGPIDELLRQEHDQNNSDPFPIQLNLFDF
jgi:transposase